MKHFTDQASDRGETYYTGEPLKQYLQRRRLSYQAASRQLGINKNTLAKAIKGGNLGIALLLHISNQYKIEISRFFRRDETIAEDNEAIAKCLHSVSNRQCDYHDTDQEACVISPTQPLAFAEIEQLVGDIKEKCRRIEVLLMEYKNGVNE